MREKSCCFTGHRPSKLSWGYNEEDSECLRLKTKLRKVIEGKIKEGVRIFYTGMAQGVDIWAAEAVLLLREIYPNNGIRLIAVIPHEEQAKYWSKEYQDRYFKILAVVDEKIILYPHYTRSCMHERNRYMVERSKYLIAVFGGEQGGTSSTIDYARKRGLEIVSIDPNTLNIR